MAEVKKGDRVRVFHNTSDPNEHVQAIVKHITTTGFVTAEVDHPDHALHGKVLTVHPDLYERIPDDGEKKERNSKKAGVNKS